MESDQLHTSHSGVFSPLRRDRQDQRGPYRSVSAGRSFSLACETPLPDPASEKYKQIANPAAIGSAMLCGVAGIAPQTVANSASYLQSWRRFLTTSSPRGLTSLSDFSSGTPPRERKGKTGWRRELDSNSRLSFLNTPSKGARTRSRALWRLKTQVRA